MAKKNNNFIQRSIIGALSFFKESIFSEEYSQKNGLLQSIDPRIKIVTFIVFIILILFVKSILLLMALYLLCLLLARLSKINLGFFLKRTWVFIPLFSLCIAIPAMFTNFNIAILFVSRVVASVSFVILLSLVTKHNTLLAVLRIFKIPQIFVTTLGMCYRYIYLFVEIIENTYLAIKSRVGVKVPYQEGQKIVAFKIAHLWQRSFQLNQEVYNAMLSRGYTGEPLVLEEFKLKIKDKLFLFCAIIILILIVYLEWMI